MHDIKAYESKLKEEFNRLMQTYANGKSGLTLTKEQCSDALGVNLLTLQGMVKDGISPSYFKVSNAKKSAYRFHTVDVARYLIENETKVI